MKRVMKIAHALSALLLTYASPCVAGDNTVGGTAAGEGMSSGTDNTLLGTAAGADITSGGYNVIIGEGGNITTGSSNILIGNSLSNTTAGNSYQLDIGDLIMGTIGSSEVAINTTTYEGTGITLGKGSALYLMGSTSGYVGFASAATDTANVVYTLPPAAPGTNGYVLSSSTTGTLSWISNGSGNVNSGTQYDLGYYATTGTAISGSSSITTDSGGDLTSTGTITGNLFSGSGASLTSLDGSNISSGTVAAARLPTGTVITTTGSPAQGDILYYNGSNWVDLAAGTDGYFLETQGASANPVWAVAGNGTVNSGTQYDLGYYATTGTAISGSSSITTDSGGDLTSTGTITGNLFSGSGASLTSLDGSNISSGTVAAARLPAGTVITTTGSPAQGDVLYYNGSNWVDLAAGTSGEFLETQGASANPKWAVGVGSGTISSGTQYQMGYYSSTGATMSGDSNITTDSSNDLNLVSSTAAFEIDSNIVLRLPNGDSTNIAAGSGALYYDTGSQNTAMGGNAGRSITSGSDNVVVGNAAIYSNVDNPLTGNGNVAVGDSASYALQGAAADNTAVGFEAGYNITTGSSNTFIGYNTYPSASTDSNELVLGAYIGGLGSNTMNLDGIIEATGTGTPSTSTTTVEGVLNLESYLQIDSNTALTLPNGDSSNIAVGYEADPYGTGTSETAVGNAAMQGYSATPLTGGGNTAIGSNALLHIEAATVGATAVGGDALFYSTGSNTAVGSNAGRNIQSGTQNVGVGNEAMYSYVDNPLSGNANVAVGDSSLYTLQGAAGNNTAVGFQAGYNISTGSSNTLIGYNTNTYGATDTNEIVIGAGVDGNGTNTATIGNSSTTVIATGSFENLQGVSTTPLFNGMVLKNTQPATASFNPNSPGLDFYSQSWDTASSGSSVESDWFVYSQSEAGNGPCPNLVFDAYSDAFNSGNVTFGCYGTVSTGNYNAYYTANNSGYQLNNVSVLEYANASTGDSTSIAVGPDANLYQSATTGNNTAVGYQAMQGISATPLSGTDSVAVGVNALLVLRGAADQETAVGFDAGEYVSTGDDNVSVGYEAMVGVSATPLTGADNTAVGGLALEVLRGAGNHNTALGYEAGDFITTGSSDTIIGYNAQASAATDTNEVVIGAGVTGNGTSTTTFQSGHMYVPGLSNASGTDIICYNTTGGQFTYETTVAGCVPSDPKLKDKGPDLDPKAALEGIMRLEPGSGVYKPSANLGSDTYVWLYADQVCNLDKRLCRPDEKGVLNYDKIGMLVYVIAAMQEVVRVDDEKFGKQDREIKELKREKGMDVMQHEIDELKAELKALRTQQDK